MRQNKERGFGIVEFFGLGVVLIVIGIALVVGSGDDAETCETGNECEQAEIATTDGEGDGS